jgi:hypothetical protein
MEIKMKINKLASVGLIFLLGFGVARYTLPVKTITVTKEVVKEKKDVVTVTKRVKLPDGTTTTERRTEDRTIRDTKKGSSTAVENEKAQWKASALLDLTRVDNYGVSVEKRLVGPVFVGAWGLQSGQVGLSLGMEW